MKLDELLSKANDTITVRRVYGEPYEKDGLTVIPAAVVDRRRGWWLRPRREGRVG